MTGHAPPPPDVPATVGAARSGPVSGHDVRPDGSPVSAHPDHDADAPLDAASGAASDPWPLLRVDPGAHAAEIARFLAKVVRGPGREDCWIWVGAIADDGYGRLWLNRGGQRVVRPHRYAAALALGVTLGPDDIVEHIVCDNPICVRAETDPTTGHVWPSTQAANLARMGQRGRGGGAWWQHRWSPTDRASLAARSRAQRDAVRDGWDAERLRAALDSLNQPTTLF